MTLCLRCMIGTLGLIFSALNDVGDGPVPAKNEIVMSPGMTIAATTEAGTIAIEAGKGLKRTYGWEGAKRSVQKGRYRIRG